MKTACLVLFLLCTALAFGQAASVISSEPVVYSVPSHPQHAETKAMAEEKSLLVSSGQTQAHGTRPLWELAPPKQETPLGDVARALKQEHTNGKKSSAVWVN